MSCLTSIKLMRSRPDLPWSSLLGTSPLLAAHLPRVGLIGLGHMVFPYWTAFALSILVLLFTPRGKQ